MAISKIKSGINDKDQTASSGSDVASAVNALIDVTTGIEPVEAITLKGLPQTAGAPEGYGDVADTVNSLFSNGIHSTAKLFNKLAGDSGDACILVVGDSTGNEQTEWIYLYASWLANQFPKYTVNYYMWGATSYAAPVIIQSGTGTNSLDIYNASVAGSKPNKFAGANFKAAVVDIPRVDLFILNHGLNLIISSTRDQYFFRTPEYLEFIASVTQIHDGCGVVMMAQNPRRDDDNYQVVYNAIIDAASVINSDVSNAYLKFIAENKNPALYADNVHPNSAGQQLFLSAIKEISNTGIPRSALSPFNGSGKNIYENDFSGYSSGAPSGWELISSSASLENSIFETAGKSVKLTSVAGNVSLMQYTIPINDIYQIRNKWITLTARLYIDPASVGQVGLVGIWTPSLTTNNTIGEKERGGWFWHSISYFVPADAADVRLRVFASGLSSTASGQVVYVDRVILSSGRLPKDMF